MLQEQNLINVLFTQESWKLIPFPFSLSQIQFFPAENHWPEISHYVHHDVALWQDQTYTMWWIGKNEDILLPNIDKYENEK